MDDEPLTSLEDPLEIGLVEPDGGEKAGAIAEQYGQGRPAPASGRRAHAADGPRARAGLPLGDAGERDKLAAVLVARGQVKERVLDGVEPELGEELGALRADARQEPERRVEALPLDRG